MSYPTKKDLAHANKEQARVIHQQSRQLANFEMRLESAKLWLERTERTLKNAVDIIKDLQNDNTRSN